MDKLFRKTHPHISQQESRYPYNGENSKEEPQMYSDTISHGPNTKGGEMVSDTFLSSFSATRLLIQT